MLDRLIHTKVRMSDRRTGFFFFFFENRVLQGESSEQWTLKQEAGGSWDGEQRIEQRGGETKGERHRANTWSTSAGLTCT